MRLQLCIQERIFSDYSIVKVNLQKSKAKLFQKPTSSSDVVRVMTLQESSNSQSMVRLLLSDHVCCCG